MGGPSVHFLFRPPVPMNKDQLQELAELREKLQELRGYL